MKNLKYWIGAILLSGLFFLAAGITEAEAVSASPTVVTLDISSLPQEVQNKIKEAQKVQEATSEIKQVSSYVELSSAIAKAVGDTAKELNIAVNDFIKTDAGKYVVFYAGYQLLGDDIRKVFVGMLCLFILFPTGMISAWRIFKGGNDDVFCYKYERVPVLWGLFYKKVVVEKTYHRQGSFSEGRVACMVVALAIGIGTGVIGLLSLANA